MKSLLLAFAVISVSLGAAAPMDNPDHVAAFKNTKNCPGCDLRSARLGGIQAPNAQLTNADLSDASFYGSVLRGADLTGAILDRTNLEMADLGGATGAQLGAAITDARTTCPDGNAGPCR